MNLGKARNGALRIVTLAWATAMLALAPQAANAQDAAAPRPTAGVNAPVTDGAPPRPEARLEAQQADNAAQAQAEPATIADASDAENAPGADAAYQNLGPEWIKGAPSDGGINIQPQYSEIGEGAVVFHHGLVWIMALISLFVLALLVYAMFRFRRSANPVPSKTTHNTALEVAWTLVPVLILVAIAIPSITLLAKQYRTAPADAVTVKVTGYQWYWGYSFPDNGDFEIISNMMDEQEAVDAGYPAQLEVDNRLVLPVGEPIRIQTTAADVIHSFAIPSLWFKIDAVPGRLNERMLTITEPGIYYGQCSELCGARHAYMPIAIEAVPRPRWEAWVRAQGGTVGPQAQQTALPTPAPSQEPESSVPGAPGAGAPPTEDTAPSVPSA